MLAIAASIILASGWRRRLIALAAGATGALAMAPFNFFPALAIPMTVAVWLIDGCAETRQKPAGRWIFLRLPVAAGRAFGAGWWWGFGYFLAGLWWLGAAFLVEADEFAWALPLGVVGLPAALAIFPGLGFMLARLMWAPGRRADFCACRRIEFCGMAARACPDRISLEHIRHGAWRQSRDRATGLARRPLRSDRHRNPYFFSSRGSRRKIRDARGKAPVAAANRRRCPGLRRDLRIWRPASGGDNSGAGRGRKIAHHAAQFGPGCEIQAGKQSPDIVALSHLVRARGGIRSFGPRRCHRAHLAGVGIPFHLVARCRRPCRNRRGFAARYGSRHRRRACGR